MPFDPYTPEQPSNEVDSTQYVADCRREGDLLNLYCMLEAVYRHLPGFRHNAAGEARWEMHVEGDFGPVPDADRHLGWWQTLARSVGLVREDETMPHA